MELQEQEVGPSKLKEAGSVELQEQGTGSEELQKQRASSGDLQEEKDTGSARLQEARSGELQEQEAESARLQEAKSVKLKEAGSVELQEVQEQGFGPGELQEQGAGLEDKIRKNLEIFETSIKQPDVAKTLFFYDGLPERRGSYKLMYEQMKEDNAHMKGVIERGMEDNISMKDYIIKLEKTVAACDLKMTENLLIENERLRILNTNLEEKIVKLESEQTDSEEVIKAFTEVESEEEVEGNPDIISLATMKESGHDRVGPQEGFKPKPKPRTSLRNKQFKCSVCKLVCDTEDKLERHMVNHDKDGDWTCDGCSYQSGEQNDLLNHLLEKRDHSATLLDHLLNKNVYERKEKCTICGELFGTKTDLHNHLNKNHKTYKPCNKMPECSGDGCRYNHNQVTPGAHLCYQCGDEFESKIELMNHMKSIHVMPVCKHYKKGNCTFGGRCWYSHMGKDHNNGVQSTQPKLKQTLDFSALQVNKPPPIQKMSNQQDLMNKMMQTNQKIMENMMSQMTQHMMNMMMNMK